MPPRASVDKCENQLLFGRNEEPGESERACRGTEREELSKKNEGGVEEK